MAARPSQVALGVELVVLAVGGGELLALVGRRRDAPYKGRWALPGTLVGEGEDLPDAVSRVLDDRLPGSRRSAHVEQLAAHAAPGRDPRARTAAVAHLVLLPDAPDPSGGSWLPVTGLLAGRLAFDHRSMLADAAERLGNELEVSPLAPALCPAEFTVAELRRVYEAVWATALDARNFHRKVTGMPGFLQPIGWTTTRDGGRPAQLYTTGTARQLRPALLRPAT